MNAPMAVRPEEPKGTRSLSENWKGPRSWLGRGRCKAARRRRCRCTSSRSANEADAPSKPEPKGRMGVARRSLRCSSSTMCMDIASSSRLALAVQAPCARPLRILGQAPRPGRQAGIGLRSDRALKARHHWRFTYRTFGAQFCHILYPGLTAGAIHWRPFPRSNDMRIYLGHSV